VLQVQLPVIIIFVERRITVKITSQMVKELRDKTNAGMMDCKRALGDTEGDMEKAVDLLRQKGLAVAAKRADRVTSEGVVECYIHAGGKLGVMVEVGCETDFVAKTDDFLAFARDSLIIRDFQIRTRHVRIKKGGDWRQIPGFVGRCTFGAVTQDRVWMKWTHLLAGFALYAGVGKNTAMGLGQTRLITG